jgi:hypothetical protein
MDGNMDGKLYSNAEVEAALRFARQYQDVKAEVIRLNNLAMEALRERGDAGQEDFWKYWDASSKLGKQLITMHRFIQP